MNSNKRRKNIRWNIFLEAYRKLHFHLKYINPEHPIKNLMLTGATQNVGTTTVAVNLAHFLFWTQQKSVLIVDCCFETSQFNHLFELDRFLGLSNILLKDVSFDMGSYRIKENGKANLTVVPCGTGPVSPSHIFTEERIRSFFNEIQGQYDFSIFDTPAVATNSWALSLSQAVDCALIVARSGVTPIRATETTKRYLATTQLKKIGLVINDEG